MSVRPDDSIAFAELLPASQRLMAMSALLVAIVKDGHPDAHARAERLCQECTSAALALHEAITQLESVTKERDQLKEQLQAIGRKAFWASKV